MNDDARDMRDEFKERVLAEFKRVHEDVKEIGNKVDLIRAKDISDMRVEIGMLKVKAGMVGAALGAVGGAVVSAIVSLLLKGH